MLDPVMADADYRGSAPFIVDPDSVAHLTSTDLAVESLDYALSALERTFNRGTWLTGMDKRFPTIKVEFRGH